MLNPEINKLNEMRDNLLKDKVTIEGQLFHINEKISKIQDNCKHLNVDESVNTVLTCDWCGKYLGHRV